MEGRERGRQENCSSEPAHSAADEASKSWNEVCVCVCVCVSSFIKYYLDSSSYNAYFLGLEDMPCIK